MQRNLSVSVIAMVFAAGHAIGQPASQPQIVAPQGTAPSRGQPEFQNSQPGAKRVKNEQSVTAKDVVDYGSQGVDIVQCVMGTASPATAAACLATGLELAPDTVPVETARMTIACGTAGVALGSMGTVGTTCQAGAIAGALGAGMIAGPGASPVGAVAGCVGSITVQVAGTALSVASCVSAAQDVQKAVAAKSLAEQSAVQASQTISRANGLQQEVVTSCHAASGTIGPVTVGGLEVATQGVINGISNFNSAVRAELAVRERARSGDHEQSGRVGLEGGRGGGDRGRSDGNGGGKGTGSEGKGGGGGSRDSGCGSGASDGGVCVELIIL